MVNRQSQWLAGENKGSKQKKMLRINLQIGLMLLYHGCSAAPSINKLIPLEVQDTPAHDPNSGIP